MPKKLNFSQKTKPRPRLTYSKSVGALQVLPITSTAYYTHWPVIRHLCKRNGYIIHLSPAAVEHIERSLKMKQARIELERLGFSFQTIITLF